jgi:hypothetical protein
MALRIAAATNIQVAQNRSSRRRSKMSAAAPAGTPRNSTGKVAAVCMSAMSKGERVKAVISQVAAVSCIQLPVFDRMEANKRLRKRGRRNGAQAESGGEVEVVSLIG